MAAGNRSVLVVVDSRETALRRAADTAVFAALDHFGVAWEVLDGGDYWGIAPGYIGERAAIVVGHDKAGAGLRPEFAAAVRDAVAGGVGLVSLDRETALWPEPLRALAPAASGAGTVRAVLFPETRHAISAGHAPGERVELLDECRAVWFADEAFAAVALGDDGLPVVAAGRRGAGRCVFFAPGPALYDETVLGHTRGLDGLLWRGLVWAARKPFPLRSIPPYVSARMDDCHGTHTAFGYVKSLNRHGVAPNLGLFIDEMGPTDWAAAARLFASGGADFSMHAFRDDFYKARPDWKPAGVLADKPDLSSGGRETRYEGLGMDHETGRDLDDATVRRNFARVDAAFGRAGIRHSRVINAHFGEIGLSSIPGLLARGADLPCNNSVAGQLYGNQPVWRPRPYGLRAANGRHGVIIDRLPQHPGLTAVSVSAGHIGPGTHMKSDILSGRVPFIGECDRIESAGAVRCGVANIRAELDALAFGMIMTHEERIDVIPLAEWERIVDGIMAGLADLETVPAGREEIGVVCKRLFDTRLCHAHADGGGLTCEITGVSDGPSPLTVWEDGPEGPVSRREEVPAVDGFARVRLPPGPALRA